MKSNIWIGLNDNDLQGCTLIVPSVAVGNVGQLACDLLISSLKMNKFASVYSPALIPVLGHDPYSLDSGGISSSCELYKCEARKIVVLQIRSPLVYKFARPFLEDLVSKVQEKGVKDIVILTSSFAHERKHVMTSPFRYVATESCPYNETINTLKWLKHEAGDDGMKIFGGGYASLLFKIAKEKAIPCLLVYKYCSEGDNIPDSYDMVQQLSSILSLFNVGTELYSTLVQPVSWKLLFGRPPCQDIY